MHSSTLLAFALVALIAIATPGPTVLLALANGSRFGLRRSVAGMLGAVASDFVLVGAVALGLGALLTASEFWFSVLKWVGAAYLAWLGWRLLRSKGGLDLAAASASTAHGEAWPRAVFAKSFLVAVTNPKAICFAPPCCRGSSTRPHRSGRSTPPSAWCSRRWISRSCSPMRRWAHMRCACCDAARCCGWIGAAAVRCWCCPDRSCFTGAERSDRTRQSEQWAAHAHRAVPPTQ
jgi:hypothetical protein